MDSFPLKCSGLSKPKSAAKKAVTGAQLTQRGHLDTQRTCASSARSSPGVLLKCLAWETLGKPRKMMGKPEKWWFIWEDGCWKLELHNGTRLFIYHSGRKFRMQDRLRLDVVQMWLVSKYSKANLRLKASLLFFTVLVKNVIKLRTCAWVVPFLKAEMEPEEWFLVDNSGDLSAWETLGLTPFHNVLIVRSFSQLLVGFDPGFCSFFHICFELLNGAIFQSNGAPFLPQLPVILPAQIRSSWKDWIPTIVVGIAFNICNDIWYLWLATIRGYNDFHLHLLNPGTGCVLY